MQQGHYVFSQVMAHLPLTTFRRCVSRYRGDHKIKRFSCLDQYLCLAFAQLTWRESLRDIEACLRAQSSKLYHLGFRSVIARNTARAASRRSSGRMRLDKRQCETEHRAASRSVLRPDFSAIGFDDGARDR